MELVVRVVSKMDDLSSPCCSSDGCGKFVDWSMSMWWAIGHPDIVSYGDGYRYGAVHIFLIDP